MDTKKRGQCRCLVKCELIVVDVTWNQYREAVKSKFLQWVLEELTIIRRMIVYEWFEENETLLNN